MNQEVNTFPIEVNFRIQGVANERPDRFSFGKYRVDRVLQDGSYVLRFGDQMRNAAGAHSNPQEEADLVLSFLSLALDGEARPCEFRVNGVAVQVPSTKVPAELIPLAACHDSLDQLELLAETLSHMDAKVARQVVRASTVYRRAVGLERNDRTFAFFLYCVAVECVANVAEKTKGVRSSFVTFIQRNLVDNGGLGSTEELGSLLKHVYDAHRSGFTHGAKPLPEAAALADKLGRAYVRNVIDGKQVKTPGARWFRRVARACLLNYVMRARQEQMVEQSHDVFKDLSVESGVLHLVPKATLNKQPGLAVFANEFELD